MSERLSNDAEVVAKALNHVKRDFEMKTVKEHIGNELLCSMVNERAVKVFRKNGLDSKIQDVKSGKKVTDVRQKVDKER